MRSSVFQLENDQLSRERVIVQKSLRAIRIFPLTMHCTFVVAVYERCWMENDTDSDLVDQDYNFIRPVSTAETSDFLLGHTKDDIVPKTNTFLQKEEPCTADGGCSRFVHLHAGSLSQGKLMVMCGQLDSCQEWFHNQEWFGPQPRVVWFQEWF